MTIFDDTLSDTLNNIPVETNPDLQGANTLEKTDYERHELSAIFPEMDEEALGNLAEDIRDKRLQTKITIYQNKILDGWNRWLACIKAKITLTPEHFEEYAGNDPLAFVISQNMQRRHLGESQRAYFAIESYEAGKLKTLGKRLGHKHLVSLFNVSLSSIERAVRVKKGASDEIKEKIKSGKMSLGRAEKEMQKAQAKESSKSEEETAGPKASSENHNSKATSNEDRNVSTFADNLETIKGIVKEFNRLPKLLHETKELIRSLEETIALSKPVEKILRPKTMEAISEFHAHLIAEIKTEAGA